MRETREYGMLQVKRFGTRGVCKVRKSRSIGDSKHARPGDDDSAIWQARCQCRRSYIRDTHMGEKKERSEHSGYAGASN